MTNEEAIKVFELLNRTCKNQPKEVYVAFEKAIEALKNERPKGKWEKADIFTLGSLYDWNYRCSLCGYHQTGETPFCPKCGARMGADNDKTN